MRRTLLGPTAGGLKLLVVTYELVDADRKIYRFPEKNLLQPT